jgi:hypothetical protein
MLSRKPAACLGFRVPPFPCSKRAKQHATPSEIEAARLACSKLLQEDETGG